MRGTEKTENKSHRSSNRSSSISDRDLSLFGANGIFRQAREGIFEFLISCNTTKKTWGHNLLTFVVEVLALLLLVIKASEDFFLWNVEEMNYESKSVLRYLFILIDPTMFSYDLTTYSIIFVTTICLVCVNVGLVMYAFLKKSTNEIFLSYCVLFFRLVRTVLILPLLHVLLSPCRCLFSDASLESYSISGETQRCYEFPLLIYVILGLVVSFILIMLGTLDAIFLLDKFKGMNSWTACPEGRFNLMIFMLQVLTVVVSTFVVPQGEGYANIIGCAFLGGLGGVFVLLFIRFVPWFHFQYVFLVSSLILCFAIFKLAGLLSYATNSYYSILTLVVAFAALPILWAILAVRYVLLLIFFKKKIRSSVFLCYFPLDVAIGIYVKNHFNRLFNLKRALKRNKKKKIVPDGYTGGSSSIEMIRLIQILLDDENFEKTKSLCSQLISLVIFKNPMLGKAVIDHTHTIMNTSWLDVEFSLEFYKLKITNMQELGSLESNSKKNRAKMMTQLNRARKRENQLTKLIEMLFTELSSEERINFSTFPQIISTIQSHQESCESVYERMVRVYPSPITYRRNAKYLLKFTGDRSQAQVYAKEANTLEFNERGSNFSSEGFFSTPYPLDKEQRGGNEIILCPTSTLQDDLNVPQSVDQQSDENISLGSRDDDDDSDGCSDSYVDDDCILSPVFDDGNITEESEEEGSRLEENRSEEEEIVETVTPKKKEEMIEKSTSRAELVDIGTCDNMSDKKSMKSKISMAFSTGGSSGERNHLSKRVVSGKYAGAVCVRVFCLSFLFYAVAGIVVIFVMSFVLRSGFQKSAAMIKLSARTQKAVIEVAHQVRKLQVSYYSEEDTPFDFERKPETFRSILKIHCERVSQRVTLLYEEMTERQRTPLKNIQVEIYDRILERNDDLEENVYHERQSSLVDALIAYGDNCFQVLAIPEFRWGRNSTIDEEYGRLADIESFFFILKNERNIHKGLISMTDDLIKTEEGTANLYVMAYILIPCLFLVFFFLNFVTCCCYTYEQKKTFRGFMMIPREELLDMVRRFSGRDDVGGGVEEEHITEGGEEQGGDGESRVRTDTSKFSLIQLFCLYNMVAFVVLFLVFSTFAVVGTLTCNMFIERNLEYSTTLELDSHMDRVHLWTVEVLYRDDSLFSKDFVLKGLNGVIDELATTYKSLRFGNKELGLKGNDRGKETYDIYYHLNCDFSDPSLTYFEECACHSLNRKVDYMFVSASQIAGVVGGSESLTNSNYTALRKSKEYLKIIVMNNISNGTVYDMGASTEDLLLLRDFIEKKVDGYLMYLQNLSLLLMMLFFPFFVVMYYVVFRNFGSRLNRNLSTPRRLMLLMKREVVFSKNIYEYVTGKSSSNFKKLLSKEKTNRLESMFSILETANYGFICFDSNFNIIHHNVTANELFRIKASETHNLNSVFVGESMKILKGWVGRNLKTSFNGELVAIYEDQEYPVLADISRSNHNVNKGELFIGVFENLESSKKKDLLKESERRTEKIEILMRNILPQEIAATTKLEDFELGTCRVFQHKRATAYFMDICNFTGMSKKTNPETIINMLHKFYCNIDILCEHHRLEKIKTIGDCYFCVSGIPSYKPLHAVSCMEFAIDVIKMTVRFNTDENPIQDIPLEVRTGISSGELVAGIIGKTKRCYDIWGPMINEAARMETNGIPGKIQVSRSTYESIFDRYEFMERNLNLQGIGTNVLAYVYTPDLSDDSDMIQILECEKNKVLALTHGKSTTNISAVVDFRDNTNNNEEEKIISKKTERKEEEEEEDGEGIAVGNDENTDTTTSALIKKEEEEIIIMVGEEDEEKPVRVINKTEDESSSFKTPPTSLNDVNKQHLEEDVIIVEKVENRVMIEDISEQETEEESNL